MSVKARQSINRHMFVVFANLFDLVMIIVTSPRLQHDCANRLGDWYQGWGRSGTLRFDRRSQGLFTYQNLLNTVSDIYVHN
jgi:hypothetical protein